MRRSLIRKIYMLGICIAGVAGLGVNFPLHAQTQAEQVKIPIQKAQMDRPATLPETLEEIRKDHKKAEFALAKYGEGKNLVLFFLNEQCGVTYYYKKRLQRLQSDFQARGFVFAGVRCGKKQHPDEAVDLPELDYLKMPFAEDQGGKLAMYFGVSQSLTFEVIDKSGKLRYRGGFDDRVEEAQVKKSYLRDALRSLSNGKPVAVKEGKAIGCSIIPDN